MLNFTYEQPATRVVFGEGAIRRLPDEVSRLGAMKALIIATPGRRHDADQAAGALGTLAAATFVEPAAHVPMATAQRANRAAEEAGADAVVVIGGGSAIGVAKGVALWSRLPIVALPTTYSGSEATPVYGFTDKGHKSVGRDLGVLPRTVLYDPALASSLPARISGPSGMNALAHCVVGLWAEDAHPISNVFATEGIAALARSLPAVIERPQDMEARTEAFYGSWLAGSMLGKVSASMHYKICHVLGGSFHLDHADVHTVMLPQSVAFNRKAAPEAMSAAAEALGARDAARAIFDLTARIGAPTSLRNIGMKEEDLDRAAELSLDSPPFNPQPLDLRGVRTWLRKAFEGKRP